MGTDRKTQRKAATTRLETGEDSIDRNQVSVRTLKGIPTKVLDWAVRHPDGRLLTSRTQGTEKTSNAEIRRRARRRRDKLLATGGTRSSLSLTMSIEDYLDTTVSTEINNAPLAPRSKQQYHRCLRLLKAELKGHSVSSALKYKTLETSLQNIASQFGIDIARQIKSTFISTYVTPPLLRDGLITRNPLADERINLAKHARPSVRKGPARALSINEQERFISALLDASPEDFIEKIKPGQHKDELIRRWRSAIEISLLQAATGLRISEARHLTCRDLILVDNILHVNVSPEASKTMSGRRTPLADERIADYFQQRIAGAQPNEVLFPAPRDPTKRKIWSDGRTGANGAVRQLYNELAQRLDIPLLAERKTHIWRTTLKARYTNAGVAPEQVSAMLGHTTDVSSKYYTDSTDTAGAATLYRASQKSTA